MLKNSEAVVKKMYDSIPELEEFERIEYIDDESNNAVIEFIVENGQVSTNTINVEEITKEFDCDSAIDKTEDQYSIKFIFQNWDFS